MELSETVQDVDKEIIGLTVTEILVVQDILSLSTNVFQILRYDNYIKWRTQSPDTYFRIPVMLNMVCVSSSVTHILAELSAHVLLAMISIRQDIHLVWGLIVWTRMNVWRTMEVVRMISTVSIHLGPMSKDCYILVDDHLYCFYKVCLQRRVQVRQRQHHLWTCSGWWH